MSYTVVQIRNAYGINSIPNFGTATADGTGQTIALVDAGNEPTILSDLDGFDQAMNLSSNSSPTIYQQYGPASSFVNVFNQSGTNITANIADSGSDGVPAEDPTGHWEGEETLDVEWAHAIAPGAKIDIIEVNDDANWATNLLVGDQLAASLPGVSSISNSWGLTEWSGETGYDSSTFVTPSGHTGVTFLTASNDNGANVYPSPPNSPAPSAGNDGYYPATSPNVVAVGGTVLTLNNDAYGSETGWSFPAPTSLVDNGMRRTRRPVRGSPSRADSAALTVSRRAGVPVRQPGRSRSLQRIRAGERRCPQPGRPARATRPMQLTPSMTATRRPARFSGRLLLIRRRLPSARLTAVLSSRNWAFSSQRSTRVAMEP